MASDVTPPPAAAHDVQQSGGQWVADWFDWLITTFAVCMYMMYCVFVCEWVHVYCVVLWCVVLCCVVLCCVVLCCVVLGWVGLCCGVV